MHYFQKILSAGVVALAMSTVPTSAATLNVVSGQLMGASGVDVGGTLYDVEFVEGSCVSVFDGCNSQDDFAFTTRASAGLASLALIDQVFVGSFDTDTVLTFGIQDRFAGIILTPYSPALPKVDVAFAVNRYNALLDASDFLSPDAYLDTLSIPSYVYADWTPTPVPLPAGGLLLLSGLGAIAALRRRKKHTA